MENALNGFYFTVSIPEGGQTDASFQEIQGLKVEIETEKIESDDDSELSYQLPKGGKYSNLVLKRGMIVRYSPFAKWCMDCIQSDFVKKIKTQNMTVKLLDPNEPSNSMAEWVFYNAYPVKWDLSAFNAAEAEILTETIEIAYTYFDYHPKGN